MIRASTGCGRQVVLTVRRDGLPIDTREALFATVQARASSSANEVKIFFPIAMEQRMLVNPYVTLSVNLSERVEVQLSNQGLETVVPKILWERFTLKSLQV